MSRGKQFYGGDGNDVQDSLKSLADFPFYLNTFNDCGKKRNVHVGTLFQAGKVSCKNTFWDFEARGFSSQDSSYILLLLFNCVTYAPTLFFCCYSKVCNNPCLLTTCLLQAYTLPCRGCTFPKSLHLIYRCLVQSSLMPYNRLHLKQSSIWVSSNHQFLCEIMLCLFFFLSFFHYLLYSDVVKSISFTEA